MTLLIFVKSLAGAGDFRGLSVIRLFGLVWTSGLRLVFGEFEGVSGVLSGGSTFRAPLLAVRERSPDPQASELPSEPELSFSAASIMAIMAGVRELLFGQSKDM